MAETRPSGIGESASASTLSPYDARGGVQSGAPQGLARVWAGEGLSSRKNAPLLSGHVTTATVGLFPRVPPLTPKQQQQIHTQQQQVPTPDLLSRADLLWPDEPSAGRGEFVTLSGGGKELQLLGGNQSEAVPSDGTTDAASASTSPATSQTRRQALSLRALFRSGSPPAPSVVTSISETSETSHEICDGRVVTGTFSPRREVAPVRGHGTDNGSNGHATSTRRGTFAAGLPLVAGHEISVEVPEMAGHAMSMLAREDTYEISIEVPLEPLSLTRCETIPNSEFSPRARGEMLTRTTDRRSSHRSVEVAAPLGAVGPRHEFSLSGEVLHVFVSYRVTTEGAAGNGLALKVARRIRSLSTDSAQVELQIPRHGWGIWPRSAKRPVPFRPEAAKVFLDQDCLLDGQNWLLGFVQGLAASMVFVPLLTWNEEDGGSLGDMSRIGVGGYDRVDHVLLELILAMALREEPDTAVQAVLPVLLGPAAEGGGFKPFPFHKLSRLSGKPSTATNAQAAAILRQLGVSEERVMEVLQLSVKEAVDQVLLNQGVQASEWGRDEEGGVTECASRVLKTVLQEMKRIRSDPKYFEQGTPMGSEVLEWLQEENLASYAPLFVHHCLDSLAYVGRLQADQIKQIFEEHEELYPKSGRKEAMGGHLMKLAMAHKRLLHRTPAGCLGLFGQTRPDERTLLLSERLERYRDTDASAMAIATSGNGIELIHTKALPRYGWVFGGTALAAGFTTLLFSRMSAAERPKRWIDAGDVCLAIQAAFVLVGAWLPLLCRTARQYADVLQWSLPLFFLPTLISCFVEWVETGDGFILAFWTPILLVPILLIRFRRRYCLLGSFTIISLAFIGEVLFRCIDYLPHESPGACIAWRLQRVGWILGTAASVLFIVVAREVVNKAQSVALARKSREHHRLLWREELTKVASSAQGLETLSKFAERTGVVWRELQEQRRDAVRSLGVGGGVMALLNQRAGRWSLRGGNSKPRQAHGNIDLLFDEAAMVNMPFLDLMASLVAGIGGVDGDGRMTRTASAWAMRREVAHPGLTLKRGPIKRPSRALQKLVRVYGRDVAMLTDLVRCTVVAEDLRQVEALMTSLDARSVVGLAAVPPTHGARDERILRITKIKNRFDESYDDSKSGGYRDLSLSVEVGWKMREGLVSFERVRDWESLECQRHICEIQVRLRSQQHEIVNEGLHRRYVELRNKYNC